MWVFPKIAVPQKRWFIMENPIEMDDLGVPRIFGNTHVYKDVVIRCDDVDVCASIAEAPLNEVLELELFCVGNLRFWVIFMWGLRRKEPGKKNPLLKNSALILTTCISWTKFI